MVAAGSDFSPGPFAPLMGIQGMVTRKGWDGKVWGANQKSGGSDPREHDPRRARAVLNKDIKIVRTAVGGKAVYEALSGVFELGGRSLNIVGYGRDASPSPWSRACS